MNIEKIYKSKKYILLIIVVLLIAVLGCIFIENKRQSKVNINGGILQEGIIPGYTEEQIKEILQRKADESTFSFEINSRPIFKDGTSEGNLRIANPPYNKHSIEVEIKLDSKDKLIPGIKEIPVLFEEADGLWINLQGKDREEQRKVENLKVLVLQS